MANILSANYVLVWVVIPLLAWGGNLDETEPLIQDFAGVEMVYIPAGCFEMGKQGAYPTEAPPHNVCIETAFWMDRFEVTNAQAVDGVFENAPADDEPEHPRVNVIWLEAVRFCAARDARLPTEAEWEYAARGMSQTDYPWGDQFYDTVPSNVCDVNCDRFWHEPGLDDGFATLGPVGSFPHGVAWSGVEDMAGNAWEWTSSIFDEHNYPYPYNAADGREGGTTAVDGEVRVARGGGWMSLPDGVRSTARRGEVSWQAVAPDIGFRCVRDVQAGDVT
jgi:formylglycine-generating enzyme required for sulfatase activity